MQQSLYVLQVSFKFELENVSRECNAIGRAIGGWYRPAMHDNKSIAFVIVSTHTQKEITDRLRPILDAMNAVNNYWCFRAPVAVESKYGTIDPMTSRIREGWERVRQGRESEHLRNAQRR
jgi:hypothetical protein